MTYEVRFTKHFDGNGNGDDYPTDFLHVPDGIIEDMTFQEMIPPVTNQTLEDHDNCEIWYCETCKRTFQQGEFLDTEIKRTGDDFTVECPDCHAALSAGGHMEECKAGWGEEVWTYEADDRLESYLDRCETVLSYKQIAEAK